MKSGKGILYICSTVVKGLIKIGKTTDFEERMRNLESNGYRNVTGLKREYAIEVENYDAIEVLLQKLLSTYRVGKTELFAMDINDAISLLSALRGTQVYPKNVSQKEVSNNSADIIRNSILPNGRYKYECTKKKDGFKANGVLKSFDGKLTLLKGATCACVSEKADPSLAERIKKLNIVNGILQDDVDNVSVSEAAGIIAGVNRDGWKCWKDDNDNIIDKYRQELNKDN